MYGFVLDSSVALSWCFPDEATPQTYEVLDLLDRQTAIVPSLWFLEVTNIVSLAVRKGRIAKPGMKDYIRMLAAYPIVPDQETVAFAFTHTLDLALEHRLTTYDASYLELAHRLQIPLASKDKALCQAAKKLKIALIEV